MFILNIKIKCMLLSLVSLPLCVWIYDAFFQDCLQVTPLVWIWPMTCGVFINVVRQHICPFAWLYVSIKPLLFLFQLA